MTSGKTWRNIKGEEKIKSYLLKSGGKEVEIKNPNELWRIHLCSSIFTYYSNGTLYSTPPDPTDKDILVVWEKIEKTAGPRYETPNCEILFGLDETGKGEIIGPVILAGVLFPAELFPVVDAIVGLANTKKHHHLGYWERTFAELLTLKEKGFFYLIEEIPPHQLKGANLNHLLDKGYRKIINTFFKRISGGKENLANYRIAIDDYGVGKDFYSFLHSLKEKKGKVIITPNADERYLEVKTAAIVAKRFRERIIKRIRENPKYQVAGFTIGSGNLADKETKEWLKKWWGTYKNFPWFVKSSFKSVKGIGG